ncbi:hypothetical protein B0T18DRAFT_394405 [Schizothecium vesticola]|uniref:Uncharacterized protein n=1 Tax=Schizothecium vesticola TaxID=314040 RepID=A0AA40BPI9_9PEZI|nr:hypothetical protein B0T18DRAFT_394405 [Schizothecium vesticola]
MEDWEIALLTIGPLIYALIAIGMILALSEEAHYPRAPPPSGQTVQREFGCLAWPVVLVVKLVAGLVRQFLYTPGYTCCGRTCAKQPPQQQPLQQLSTPAKARSDEHNLEAGLNPAPPTPPTLQGPAEVVSVPPPAHEAMGSKSAALAGPSPPYK